MRDWVGRGEGGQPARRPLRELARRLCGRLCGRIWGQRAAAAVLLGSVAVMGIGCKAEPWPLWDSYTARFLDDQGRVIDHSAGDRTTTEGQAYAMFFALVANDPGRFKKLLDWTQTNLAGGDLTLRLPAWSWGKAGDGSWKVLDPNSAADADLWMAYSLCEAGRLWGIDRYSKLGDVLADRVAQQEVVLVPGVGTTLLPGSDGFHPSPEVFYLNPSYLPPMLLGYFAHRKPQAPWGQVLASLPRLVSSPGGFAMDWLKVQGGAVEAAPMPAASTDASASAATATGSYDAIRVYLWMGLADGKTRGVKESIEELRAMALYLSGHVTPPLAVDPAGKVLSADAPPGFSAAVLPYLHALGLTAIERAQSDRLAATRDTQSGLYGRGDYYDQNLALFATGWSEQRFRFESDGRVHVRWKP